LAVGEWRVWRLLMQRPVRTVRVVVLDVFLEHLRQVSWPSDQHVVEAFAAQRADEALGDRVRTWCPDRGAEDADVGGGEDSVEGGGDRLEVEQVAGEDRRGLRLEELRPGRSGPPWRGVDSGGVEAPIW
jgi:hypothetical protein